MPTQPTGHQCHVLLTALGVGGRSILRPPHVQNQTHAAHSSIHAWEIPWMEEPGGLQSMGLQKNQTRLSD